MRRTVRAAFAATVLCLSLSGTVATFAPLPAGADSVTLSPPEAQFLAKINNLRASKGLGALAIDGQLTSIARNWTAHMASAGAISHNPNLATQVTENWQKLGENVGEGPDVDTLFQAFVNSPHHYANLVDPAFSLVGIGVVVAPDGTMYTTHDFEQPASSPAPPPPPQPQPAPQPQPQPSPSPSRSRTVPPAAPVSPAPTAAPTPGTSTPTTAPAISGASSAAGSSTESGHRVVVVLDELHSLDGTDN